MAALTITENDVAFVSGTTKTRIAGATLTRGMCYYVSSGNTVNPCDANSGTAAHAVAVGIVLNGGLTGDYIVGVEGRGSIVDLGAVLTKGLIYCVGATAAGDINPSADVTTGWELSILGYAATTNNLVLLFENTGLTV